VCISFRLLFLSQPTVHRRFKEVNTRLRKLLAEERRSLQQVRQNYNNELGSRPDLEMVLRDCVEDVRKENERR
jgi:hypothetical protein